ncbi:MAG: hypothetical protein CM15mP58_20610 [Burkholderiaceae bacterium]|nr:MAG: hypothetical protein CM15mP58_20610 [Burkholderiaceae bacterium]
MHGPRGSGVRARAPLVWELIQSSSEGWNHRDLVFQQVIEETTPYDLQAERAAMRVISRTSGPINRHFK